MKPLFAVTALYVLMVIGFSQNNPSTLDNYRKALDANPRNSLAHYRMAEIFMRQQNYQSAANEFREALNGDLEPNWIEGWSHLSLGRIFDITGQHERALNEYEQAYRSRDVVSLPDDPTATSGVYLGANSVIGSEPIERTDPEYSEEGRLAGLEGIVLLTSVIAEDGAARDLRVMRPLGLGLDEKAVEAVRTWRFSPGTYQGRPVPVSATVAVYFRLPSKQSRWHLIRAVFSPPSGTSRPVFLSVKYPLGAGVTRATFEEARIVAAVGRLATASLAFDVDEEGRPVHFQVQSASESVWANEAVALVRAWRFKPGMKGGIPVTVPCMLDLVWGQRNLTGSVLAQLDAATKRQALAPPPDVFPPPAAGEPRLRIDSGVQATRLVTTVTPEYPQLAKQAGVQGSVHFYALIGPDGHVQGLQLISGHPLLVPAATDAVNQSVYRPTMLNGIPVEVTTQVNVDFRLTEGPVHQQK